MDFLAVELLLYLQCRLGTKIAQGQNLVPLKPVEIDAFDESTMIPRPEFYKSLRQGRIAAHRTDIETFTRDGVILRNGDALGVDCVVFGTGWKNNYSFLSADVRDVLAKNDDDGFYLYRHMLHPDLPNLIFISCTATYLNILTYCLQALRYTCAGERSDKSAGRAAHDSACRRACGRSYGMTLARRQRG